VAALKSEFDRRGVTVIAVSFADPAKLASYQDRHRWPFRLFADPERKVYTAFNLKRLSWFRVFSPATLARYLKLSRRGMKREVYGGDDIYQSGGDFLVDRSGTILFAYRGQGPADRPAPAKLLLEIDRLLSEAAGVR
jgi:AhpC/TSA antioxidant enzyme